RSLALLRQRHGLVGEGDQRLLAGVELPARVVVDLLGREGALDDPAGRGLLPARPAFAARAQTGEPLADGDAERARLRERIGVARRADGDVESGLHDELPLRENGTFEALDVLDRRA